MTLREILKQRAQRRRKLAESKRTSARDSSRRTRRETIAERKLNRFIESKQRMNRKHYILVEDENEDDLVEIEPDETDIDTDDAGEDISKEEIIKSLEELAAQVGMKVVPDDEAANTEESVDGKDCKECNPTVTDASAPESVTTEADDKEDAPANDDESNAEASAGDVPDDGTDDASADKGSEDGTEDAPDDASADKGSEDGTEDAPDDEAKEDVAKKLAELTPNEWLDILAKIPN